MFLKIIFIFATQKSLFTKSPFACQKKRKKLLCCVILHAKDSYMENVNYRAEIRVQFRHVPGNLYKGSFGTDLDRATNELVIRVQPDEAIYLKINNKIPGLGMRLDRSNLNLHYAAR
jgi:hypothetical protein